MRELNLIEAHEMLSAHSLHEILDIYLTLGGMPEYLRRFKNKESTYLTLCKESFQKGAFFSKEPGRIFSSSLGENNYYQIIINYLSQQKFATRADISKHLKLQSGGGLTALLSELSECGFIEKYAPYNLASKSNVSRYCITDAYLQFYFKCIDSLIQKIEQGDYDKDPTSALNITTYQQWLGYAFERFCRKYHRVIASILGFSAVKYRSGVYFNRRTDESNGYQIDLLFDRDDKVMTVCEIKYLKSKVPSAVIDEFEERMQFLPNLHKKTIHRVLISNHGPAEGLIQRAYFDRFILIEDLFKEMHW